MTPCIDSVIVSCEVACTVVDSCVVGVNVRGEERGEESSEELLRMVGGSGVATIKGSVNEAIIIVIPKAS